MRGPRVVEGCLSDSALGITPSTVRPRNQLNLLGRADLVVEALKNVGGSEADSLIRRQART